MTALEVGRGGIGKRKKKKGAQDGDRARERITGPNIISASVNSACTEFASSAQLKEKAPFGVVKTLAQNGAKVEKR